MTPVDGGRFCGDCKKVVRDLSAMTEDEARKLLAEPRRAELCVRYMYDRDGDVVFASAPREALVPPTFLHRAKRAATAALSLAAPLAFAACGGAPEGEDSPNAAHAARQLAATIALEDDADDGDDAEYSWNMGGAMPPPHDGGPATEDAATNDGDAGSDAEAEGDADAGESHL